MDQNLSAEEKKKIYEDLFDITFEQLKSKKISLNEGQKIAGFVLDNMEGIIRKKEYIVFLEKLAKNWAIYNPYYLKNKSEKTKLEDEKKISELTSKLKQLIN
ncbi:MAG: hypothetical protein AAB437_03305 [Patescibacteria group bacterium]